MTTNGHRPRRGFKSMDLAGMLPRHDQRLDLQAVRHIPRVEGVYAAWITTREALVEIGIDGPPPVLVYIGKATGVGGLRTRLRRHASSAWWELIDLLASRRTVLPGWWSHSQKNTGRRTLLIPPLAMVSHAQALDWQHRNVRWAGSRIRTPARLRWP